MARYIVEVKERVERVREVSVTARNKKAAMEAAMEDYGLSPDECPVASETVIRARPIGATDIDLPPGEDDDSDSPFDDLPI